MSKKITYLFVLMVSVALYSCQKIPGHVIQPGAGSSSSSGSTGGAGSTTSGTYSPVTTGTYWTYKVVLGTSVDTTTNTMSGSTTTINNKIYSVVNAKSVTNGASLGYFSNVNHVYTLASPVPGSVLILEFQYLIDNVAVGANWTTLLSPSGTINGVPARLLGQITEIGINKTVMGVTFNNVIHTTLQLQYNYGSGYQTNTTYDYYVAKGIGIIEIDSIVGLPGFPSVTGQTAIISYKIN